MKGFNPKTFTGLAIKKKKVKVFLITGKNKKKSYFIGEKTFKTLPRFIQFSFEIEGAEQAFIPAKEEKP